jgi:hypothetical protein
MLLHCLSLDEHVEARPLRIVSPPRRGSCAVLLTMAERSLIGSKVMAHPFCDRDAPRTLPICALAVVSMAIRWNAGCSRVLRHPSGYAEGLEVSGRRAKILQTPWTRIV